MRGLLCESVSVGPGTIQGSPSWCARIDGRLAHKKQPPPPGSPSGPRHSPTVGSYGGAVSYERGTPVDGRRQARRVRAAPSASRTLATRSGSAALGLTGYLSGDMPGWLYSKLTHWVARSTTRLQTQHRTANPARQPENRLTGNASEAEPDRIARVPNAK